MARPLDGEFNPAIADCGYRAPLHPRLARPGPFYPGSTRRNGGQLTGVVGRAARVRDRPFRAAVLGVAAAAAAGASTVTGQRMITQVPLPRDEVTSTRAPCACT